MSDYIKRDDVIKVIRECRPWHFCELVSILSAIKDIPAAEPKSGKWIKDICEYDRVYHFKCSVCGEWNGLSVEEWNWTPNFCPNCGARMKGADDESLR